jgi:hypothetical protein
MPIPGTQWLSSMAKQAGRVIGIGGNPGPQNILGGIYSSQQSTPPLLNTRSMLEGYDGMPWLRAASDRVGTAIAMIDWSLYAIGKPAATLAPVAEELAGWTDGTQTRTLSATEISGMVGRVIAREADRRIGKLKGRLEPWAVRDRSLQRMMPDARWKSIDALRKAGRLTRIDEHPFLDALEKPNPFMGRSGLMKITEVSMDLVGDAFWLYERANIGGAPTGFWPLPAHWIIEMPTPGRPWYRVGWSGWNRLVPESEILRFPDPSPVHPYDRGSGVGFALGDELEIDEYLAKMTKQMFFNDADPKWIMAGGGDISESEMRRLERDFLNRNQGFWRKFKPYFMVGGGDDINKRIHEFQRPTMEQLVYPGLRKAQRDVVVQTFGVPPEMFGITESSNRATAEAAEYIFSKWVILPRADRLRSILQAQLMPLYDDRILIDFPNPVTEDKVHVLNVRKSAPWAWTVDEWRALGGDAPLPVSDNAPGAIHMVPMNSYLTDDLADETKRPAAPTPIIAPPTPPGDTPPGQDPDAEADPDADPDAPKDPDAPEKAGGGQASQEEAQGVI